MTGGVEELRPALPHDIVERAERVLGLADASDAKIATAESCTGGLLAALLTDVRGLGHVFDRGIVSYSKEAKCDLLGIDRQLVDRCGAVSREVALAMATGALDRSLADFAVSITGFAGPAGADEEEGLVHFGLACAGGEPAHREEHFGAIGRDGVRLAALRVALDLLAEGLEGS